MVRVSDPYAHLYEETDEEEDDSAADSDDSGAEKRRRTPLKPTFFDVDVDLDLNADQNCRKFYQDKKAAVEKKHRTLQASAALKNAQKQMQNKVEQVIVLCAYCVFYT